MTQSEIFNLYEIISSSLKERFKAYDVELNLNVNPEAVATYNIVTSCLNGVFLRLLRNAEPEKTWVEAVAETKMNRSEPSLVFDKDYLEEYIAIEARNNWHINRSECGMYEEELRDLLGKMLIPNSEKRAELIVFLDAREHDRYPEDKDIRAFINDMGGLT